MKSSKKNNTMSSNAVNTMPSLPWGVPTVRKFRNSADLRAMSIARSPNEPFNYDANENIDMFDANEFKGQEFGAF